MQVGGQGPRPTSQASQAAAELRYGNMTAREVVFAALRRRADAEAAARAAEKRRALDFVRAPVEAGDLRQLRALLAALAQTLAALEQLPNGASRALFSPIGPPETLSDLSLLYSISPYAKPHIINRSQKSAMVGRHARSHLSMTVAPTT